MNGLGLLDELKTFRVKIVALVKVARGCNKYSMDLHAIVLDMDKESKAFADYVSSAYERASQRAAAAASSSSPTTVRSTMARPPPSSAAPAVTDVTGDTIRRTLPSGADSQRGSMPKGLSGTSSLPRVLSTATAKTAASVDQFLDQMEQNVAPRSAATAIATPVAAAAAAPRERKFDEDEYNSLVAELELPAAKRGKWASVCL